MIKGSIQYFFNIIYLFYYFWLHWVLVAIRRLSQVVESEGYSLGVVCGLFILVASLVGKHRLQVHGLQ